MNVIFITIDGARVDRIKNGKNYKNIIQKSTFFPNVITYAPYTISAMHAAGDAPRMTVLQLCC